MVIKNTYFRKKQIHKYTWVSKITGNTLLLNYILIGKVFRERLKDVNALMGAAGGLSDHYVVVGSQNKTEK